MRTLAALLALTLPIAAADVRYVGMSKSGKPIEATIYPGSSPTSLTVMLIGGLDGVSGITDVNSAVPHSLNEHQYNQQPQAYRERVIAIPNANPDGSQVAFPPTGTAYHDNPEANALWRWIGTQAPDEVLIAGSDFGLADALSKNKVAGVGAIRAEVGWSANGIMTVPIFPSDAHIELVRRLARSPWELAQDLAPYYGHDFDQLTYIPGMALIAQMRLGHVADVEKLASQYIGKDNLTRASSLTLAGHMVFGELALRTGDPRYTDLVRKAADLGFAADGQMKESMPFHDEMSDSFFMATPMVAMAGKLTGETKYYDMALRHFQFMTKLDLRPDGLYRHSPLTDAAWSRGNSFPALGMALTLTNLPKNHAAFTTILAAFQQHMKTLLKFQDEDGMWHEVIDQPASYAEFSATAMIGTAMLRGIRNGWLDAATYQPAVDKAWRGILARVGPEGELIDVCESTNKQKTLDDYLHRAAILGKDPRGGAMALLFATEMAGLP